MDETLKRRVEIQWAIDPLTDEELSKKCEEVQAELDAMTPEEILKGRAEVRKVIDALTRFSKMTEEDFTDLTPEEIELLAELLRDKFPLLVRWSKNSLPPGRSRVN